MSGVPEVVTTTAGLRRVLREPKRRAVVMTMGALHEGHLTLVRRARELAEQVVVTIFVNPLQFGPDEDLDRYPRTLEADLALLAREGVDVVFAPPVEQMYPDGAPRVTMSAGTLGRVLEGAIRPGHFDGVCTVVLKLLNLTRPDVALFGEKDAQQLLVIQRMVRDLDIDVEIVGVPIKRDDDGLALSSRNVYLDAAARERALVLSRSLAAGEAVAGSGSTSVLDAVRGVLEAADDVDIDYLVLVDPTTVEAVGPDYEGPARLLVAARIGEVRLIDNTAVLVANTAVPNDDGGDVPRTEGQL